MQTRRRYYVLKNYLNGKIRRDILKNESLIKLSLLSCVIGIGLLYIGAVHMRAELTPISKIDNDFVGLNSKISGRIIELSSHPEGHIFTKVKDESGGVISVPIFSGVRSDLEKRVELLDRIQAKGKVEKYEGELEILPGKAKNISVIKTVPTEISKIDRKDVGSPAKIRGFVDKKLSLDGGHLKLVLTDGKGRLGVFIPGTVAESEGFPDIKIGQRIRVCGVVQTYQGQTEVEVGDSHNIIVNEDPT